MVAGAGCGKTTTLVAKCIRLLQLNPQARFCAVSFTEKSVKDLKANLAQKFQEHAQEGGPSFRPHDHWVKTIHGLCYSIIQEFPEAAGLIGGERILMEDESRQWWRRSLEPLWSESDSGELDWALERLLAVYSRGTLEGHLAKLQGLQSFGIEEHMTTASPPLMQDLWRVYQSVALRYQRAKQRLGALDFNDLEICALRALKHPRVQKYYQKRFDLVLVDEFQDTNPVQGQILQVFVRPDLSNLCIVGDPKQSIYRFRDADVSVFQDWVQRLPEKNLLTRNYRSVPGIIEFVNQVCEPLFAASELEYEPLIAERPKSEGAPLGEVPVIRAEVDSVLDLPRYLQLLTQKGVALQDVVILARSVKKDTTAEYLNALEAAQIPYLFGSGGRFFSDPRVIELVALLRGWLTRENSLSQVAALRAPWIGVSDAELFQWKSNTDPVNYFESFFRNSSHPVAMTLKDWYLEAKPVRPGEILQALWGLESIPEEMLLTLATLWQKTESLSLQGRRFSEIVDQLQTWIDEEKIESDIPPPAQAGAVRILTVHASKGLQFPHVVLIDFEKPARPDGKKDLLWNRREGLYLFARDSSGSKVDEAESPENSRWTQWERQAEVAESKRVFYVALTRAQETLTLIWKRVEKESFKSREEDLKRDFWRAWVEHLGSGRVQRLESSSLPQHLVPPVAQAPNASNARSSVNKSEAALKALESRYRPRHSASEWLVLQQCPLKYFYQYSVHSEFRAPVLEDSAEASPEADPNLRNFVSDLRITETSAEKGERLHLALENEDWDAIRGEFQDAQVGQEVVQVLQPLLQAESEIPNGHVFREVGFEVPLSQDEALVGFMDRLWIVKDEAGPRVRVTDYKWTSSPRAAEELRDQYLLQLQAYAWAATQMLGQAPSQVEARLLHFTQQGVTQIEVPTEELRIEVLEKRVLESFHQAQALLFGRGAAPVEQARPAKHCRYCDYQMQCPKALH